MATLKASEPTPASMQAKGAGAGMPDRNPVSQPSLRPGAASPQPFAPQPETVIPVVR